jgi:hypothetical protein
MKHFLYTAYHLIPLGIARRRAFEQAMTCLAFGHAVSLYLSDEACYVFDDSFSEDIDLLLFDHIWIDKPALHKRSIPLESLPDFCRPISPDLFYSFNRLFDGILPL